MSEPSSISILPRKTEKKLFLGKVCVNSVSVAIPDFFRGAICQGVVILEEQKRTRTD